MAALAIITFGVVGYMITERWGFLDSLYQTVITISTVGFGEVHPISTSGRIITIILILFAISLLAYFFSKFVTIMVKGRLNVLLRGRKMEKKIAKLRDHFVICGFGKMGIQVAREFQRSHVPFVVLDNDPAAFERERAEGMLYIIGDASREEDLERCDIRHATGFVSVLTEDQDTVSIQHSAGGRS